MDCGEEDVDWEIVPIKGKGLGIVAKRMIPSSYRIMVDAICTDPSAAVDLMPIGGTLEEKVELNQLGTSVGPVLCLKISRVNHDCRDNAGHFYVEDIKVKILYAIRDIKKGEKFVLIINRSHMIWKNPRSCRLLCEKKALNRIGAFIVHQHAFVKIKFILAN